MKKLLPLSLAAMVLALASCGGNTSTSTQPSVKESTPATSEIDPASLDDDKVHIIILAGQSGARGKAVKSELPEEFLDENLDVDIVQDGYQMSVLNRIPDYIEERGIQELKPGYGDSANEFGPELGIGQTMASRYQKDGSSLKNIIVKFTACGSTMIADWFSTSAVNDESISPKLNLNQQRNCDELDGYTGPLTSNLYQLIDYAKTLVEAEGFEWVIDGATFIHGEQDTKFDANMEIYEKCLEYWVKDLRTYLGINDLPVVITEALTNSGKYANSLREMQKRVADSDTNTYFIDSSKLYTNTFEPWHFGALSNIELGNRIAAEILSHKDNRTISAVNTTFEYPKGVEGIALPKYLCCEYSNGTTGYSKVKYTGSFSVNEVGEKQVDFEVDTANGIKSKGKLNVNVSEAPYVDGKLNDLSLYHKMEDCTFGDLYTLVVGTKLYVALNVNDTLVYTDGEDWNNYDMGQAGKNDDFRVFIADGEQEGTCEHITICLSAANLFRVYNETFTSFTDQRAPQRNMVYKRTIENFDYHCSTKGLVNVENTEGGFIAEFSIDLDELGIDAQDAKILFARSDISGTSAQRSETITYFQSNQSSATSNLENDLSAYMYLM